MAKALLAVDLQNDFYEDGALAVPNASEINPKVNELLESDKYQLIVGSQDWHPTSHLSFASNHGKDPFTPYSDEQGLGPVYGRITVYSRLREQNLILKLKQSTLTIYCARVQIKRLIVIQPFRIMMVQTWDWPDY